MRGFYFIIIFSLTLAACNYTISKQGAGTDAVTGLGDSLDSNANIDWTLMRDVVLVSCKDCHSGRQSPNLNGYSEMTSHISLVYDEVSTQGMPPVRDGYTSLSACRIAAVKKWIDLGTPEVSNVKVATLPECPANINKGAVPIQDLPLSYDNLLKVVLQPKCITCHNSQDSSDAAFVLFYPYSELANNPQWRAPGAKSKVVRMISRTDDARMPPPEVGGPLSPEEIDYFIRWIDAGKPQ